MDLKLTPNKLVRVLSVVMAVLVIFHCIACLPMFLMGRSHPLGFMSLDGEYNLPSMFSAALLWFCALLAGCIAWAEGNGQLNKVYWSGLALAFLVAGLDESIMFHERCTVIIRELLDSSGLFYFAWVIPYAVLALMFVVIYCRFFFSLPEDTRKHLAIAVLLFVGGAIGWEMLGGAWMELHGKDAVFYLLATIEEIMEMSGSIAFIYAFSCHMARYLPDLRLSIVSD